MHLPYVDLCARARCSTYYSHNAIHRTGFQHATSAGRSYASIKHTGIDKRQNEREQRSIS